MTTSTNDYNHWLKGCAVLLVDADLQDMTRYQAWLTEAEAAVMALPLGDEVELPLGETATFDIAIIGSSALDERLLRIAAAVRTRHAGCGVLLQAHEAHPQLMRELRLMGASFLSKGASKADFMFAMTQLLDSGIPDVELLVARAQRRWRLSRQQTRILYYNLWSCSNEEIAGSLGVSLNTVQEYQQKLRSKTGARAKDGYFRLLMEMAGRRAPGRAAGGPKRAPAKTVTAAVPETLAPVDTAVAAPDSVSGSSTEKPH